MKHNMVISNRLSRDGRGAMNANDELQLNKKKPPGSSLRISAEGAVTMAQEETLLDLKKQAITNEYNLTVLKNKMERTTMKLRMELLDQELVARNKANGGDGNYAGRENLKQTIKMLADDGPFDTMQKNVAKAIRDGAKNGLDATDADLKERREGELMGSDGSLTGSIIGDMQEKGGIDSLDKTSKKIKAMGLAMAPMIENLKKLGPEGELVAAMAQGGFTIGEAWANAGEKMQSSGGGTLGKAQKAEAVLGAIGASLSMISNILNAASDMRIAQIDKEIAAEKKRDGQTKGSLNKIAALEAKKEAEKKKAFETNKKMQMAMVVVNTAMAISAAVASGAQAAIATGGTTLPAWVGAFVAIVSVLGAAQLALIAGTSYQGGGGGIASASTPSSVSVGERRNTVDTSKSEGGAGELAYMRGDQGTGGPENFRGAFYGKKHRAAGGDTGYIVGEQGPELFMTDRPGTIVTADDTAARGGGSNVTFNIGTVDAAGVEDLLAEQQGNIIGMLRQASNSYGEEFMEDIDTTAVSGSSARRA